MIFSLVCFTTDKGWFLQTWSTYVEVFVIEMIEIGFIGHSLVIVTGQSPGDCRHHWSVLELVIMIGHI